MSRAEPATTLRRFYPSLPVLVVPGYADAEGIAPGLVRRPKPFPKAELAASLPALV